MGIDSTASCDFPHCEAQRKQVNNWYVVLKDSSGVHVYHWDECPPRAMKEGQHFCGIAHTIQTVSNMITPDTTNANRESTLELKPPLTREGTVPVAEQEPTGEEVKNDGKDQVSGH
jgi:hypothetical protein